MSGEDKSGPPRDAQGRRVPPSLAGVEADDTRERLDPLTTYHIVYRDEFAPSWTTVRTSDPEVLQTPRARLLFYNEHIIDGLDDIRSGPPIWAARA